MKDFLSQSDINKNGGKNFNVTATMPKKLPNMGSSHQISFMPQVETAKTCESVLNNAMREVILKTPHQGFNHSSKPNGGVFGGNG
jgi:hypothetical protein